MPVSIGELLLSCFPPNIQSTGMSKLEQRYCSTQPGACTNQQDGVKKVVEPLTVDEVEAAVQAPRPRLITRQKQ